MSLDEISNLPQIYLVKICCKYEIRKALQPVQRWRWPNLPQKRANSAITTLALGAKLCKAHTCKVFAQGKFDANSYFRPVCFSNKSHSICWKAIWTCVLKEKVTVESCSTLWILECAWSCAVLDKQVKYKLF